MNKEFSVLLCGVGGQGLVLLSNIIGTACARDNLRVITGEQHGLSQRSGTISVHLRIGPEVRSPLIPIGSADALLSLEALEALRYIEYLKDNGAAIFNNRIMHPVTETGVLIKDKNKPYMNAEEVIKRVQTITPYILTLDALHLAEQAGNSLTENVVLLGALCVLESFPVSIPSLKQAIAQLVPAKAQESNIKAFDLGARAAYDRFCKEMACKQIGNQG
ncbi:MAG: indolepyruvate ferredoxin oxidoreductase subunit beta [Desulfobacteraceae bacterium]|nr:MAG: indolepyruvate ferredoxin oxidoreductase subunit beta [Desulfobacteraceae bacterium]